MDKAFYRKLLDSQRSAILLLDDDLRIHYINAAAEALLYIGRHRLIGQPLPHWFRDQQQATDNLTDCLWNDHPVTCREVELRYTGGSIQLIDYSVSRLRDDQGQPKLLVEMQPIGQLMQMSREKGQQQAYRTARQLVRGVAHEIKNPLGGIRGSAQLLASELDDDRWREYLDVIIAESDRLSDLADRMSGAKHQTHRDPVNIHVCLERVRQLVQTEQPELLIKRDYDPSLPLLHGDRNQLVQALLNLVRNAMQVLVENHVEKGCILLRTRAQRQITLNAKRHRLALRIEVIDNGPGVPPALQDALFFPLITGRAKGTGLGLPFVQDIAKQHQGMVDCDSRPGRTCFSLYLPIVTATAEEATHA